MSESNTPDKPEINVDALVLKIRQEIARRRAESSPVAPQPQLVSELAATVDWLGVEAGLDVAEQHAQLGDFVPGWARFGQMRRRLAQYAAQVILYLSSFITNQQKQFNAAILRSLRTISDGVRSLERGFAQHEGQSSGLEGTINQIDAKLTVLEQAQYNEFRRLTGELDQRDQRLGHLEETLQTVRDSLTGELDQRDQRLGHLEETLQTVRDGLTGELDQRDQRLGHQEETLQTVRDGLTGELGQRDQRLQQFEQTLSRLKTELILQERRIGLLLEEARKRLPAPFDDEQLHTLADEEKHQLDALYLSFEDQFRGTREDIKDRLKVYLPLLHDGGIGTQDMPILDVGCGRGEWLEILHEAGLVVQGLDINHVLVEQCRQRGFEVAEGDVIAHLRSLPERSIGAVTGFHLIEHLSFPMLMALLDETVRVLKPGGVAIFETPNPQNLQVGGCNFYFDPTHRNPLPSPTMQFLAEARGLCRVAVWNLHPFPETVRVCGSELAARFNDFFYGPQDYAVVGWKV